MQKNKRGRSKELITSQPLKEKSKVRGVFLESETVGGSFQYHKGLFNFLAPNLNNGFNITRY
jgi:hypothetical protein